MHLLQMLLWFAGECLTPPVNGHWAYEPEVVLQRATGGGITYNMEMISTYKDKLITLMGPKSTVDLAPS